MSGLGEGDGRTILDDEGRLFGLVNVVDLLVVLLVLAVVVAGVALLFSSSPDAAAETETRHVTMDLGAQPDYIAEQITVGDSVEPAETGGSLKITDVYRYEAGGGTNVVVRATVNGTVAPSENTSSRSFQFGETEFYPGQQLSIRTVDYRVEGQITQVRRSGESLPTQESEFTIETTISTNIADRVAVGDTYRVGGKSVAEITALQQFPSGTDGERTLRLGLSAQTIDRDGLEFAGTPLRVGNTVPFRTDDYQISGEVRQRNTNIPETERRPFVIESTVPVDLVTDISVGDEYRLGGETLIRVESTAFYTTDQAGQRRAVLGLSVLTSEDDGTILFGDRELRVGQSLPVKTGEYDISGEIIRRDTLDQAGEQTSVDATLQIRNIRPEIASTITAGDIERTGDQTTVEITSQTTQPAEIILESESGEIFLREHPRNLDVELEADLQARQLDDGSLQFRGEPLRIGDTIPIELGQLRVTVEVSDLDGT